MSTALSDFAHQQASKYGGQRRANAVICCTRTACAFAHPTTLCEIQSTLMPEASEIPFHF
jgi:hypothetical protein